MLNAPFAIECSSSSRSSLIGNVVEAYSRLEQSQQQQGR